jgi:hypothetical protein
MTNEELAAAIVSELTLAYMQAGSHISADNALQVAKSYCEEMDFRDLTEVHEAFRRAKTVADIPTQRTLSEALKNYRAETLTPKTGAPALEYKDPRAAWLPSDLMRKRINLITAMKNYCAAVSDTLYAEYCRVHVHTKVEDKWKFVNPEKVKEFDAPIKRIIHDLYPKYWRKCSCAAGYPEDAKMNLGLSAPTVLEFKAMIYYEQYGH